jgi:carbon-monoxide dehydrogenase large subunit
VSTTEVTTATPGPNQGWIGRAMRRKEDPRMISGRGSYTENMALPGML